MKELRSLVAMIPTLLLTFGIPAMLVAQDHVAHEQNAHPATEEAHQAEDHNTDDHHTCHFHADVHATEYDPTGTAFHHIADANVYSIGSFNFPLPCILYTKGHGWDFFSSGHFEFDFYGHGEGRKAFNQYVLDAGAVKRVEDPAFPTGAVALDGFMHTQETIDGETKEIAYACYNGAHYKLVPQSTGDMGLFGGGITSFYDFSLTKNVVSMFLISLLLAWGFFSIAKAYKTRDNMAPKGLQSFMEPIFLFVQDEVAKPFLGPKWEKFLPLLMSLFFFILGLNLFGQIPIFGGSNVTGNLAVTAVLAIITFVVHPNNRRAIMC